MSSNFQTAFTKLSLLGQSKNALLDCSELIVRPCTARDVVHPLTVCPEQATPPPAKRKQAFFPPGKTHADIEQGVRLSRCSARVLI